MDKRRAVPRAGQPKSLARLTNRRPYRQHRRPRPSGFNSTFAACPGGSGHGPRCRRPCRAERL